MFSNLVDSRDILFYQTNEVGFRLTSEEHRHIDIPVQGVDPSKFPEKAKLSLPTTAQLTSGDFISAILILIAYKTVFGKIEHIGDCAFRDRQQQFRHCWATVRAQRTIKQAITSTV
jgi:hypothetical protein